MNSQSEGELFANLELKEVPRLSNESFKKKICLNKQLAFVVYFTFNSISNYKVLQLVPHYNKAS